MSYARIVPRIAAFSLPEAERESGHFVVANLMSLANLLDSVRAGVALFEFARDNHRNQPDMEVSATIRLWGTMGAREGALAIYGFYQVEKALNGLLRKCPTLSPHADYNLLKEARRDFSTAFPNFGDVRLGAAHPGELTATPEKARQNSAPEIKGDGFDVSSEVVMALSGCMMGSAYTYTVDGKSVSYEVSAKSVNALFGVFEKICAALRPLENVTSNLLRPGGESAASTPPA